MLIDAWATEELATLEAKALTRVVEPVGVSQQGFISVAGVTLINLSSNDYLGLAADEAVRSAAKLAIDQYGFGSGSSRLVVGDSPLHQALEQALAAFKGTETALLFNSGYAANSGIIPALMQADDVIFSDALNHASIVDGCRLSKAKVVTFPHCDVGALELLATQYTGRRRLVVTDAIFSMDGDRAPLKALRSCCDRLGMALMVDEAHSAGLYGATGAGLCELEGVTADIQMGTLSKAFGSMGAYVTCSQSVRTLLLSTVRPFIFSTALPAAACGAALAALHRLKSDSALRLKLHENIRFFAQGLQQLGVAATEASPIFSVIFGDATAALDASAAMRRSGVLVKAIRPPTVAPGTSRLRFSLSAAHSTAQLTQALEALAPLVRTLTSAAATPLVQGPSLGR